MKGKQEMQTGDALKKSSHTTSVPKKASLVKIEKSKSSSTYKGDVKNETPRGTRRTAKSVLKLEDGNLSTRRISKKVVESPRTMRRTVRKAEEGRRKYDTKSKIKKPSVAHKGEIRRESIRRKSNASQKDNSGRSSQAIEADVNEVGLAARLVNNDSAREGSSHSDVSHRSAEQSLSTTSSVLSVEEEQATNDGGLNQYVNENSDNEYALNDEHDTVERQQKQPQKNAGSFDFFNNFGSVPSLSKISSQLSMVEEKEEIIDDKSQRGYFVNPLTGSYITITKHTDEEKDEEEDEDEGEDEDEEEEAEEEEMDLEYESEITEDEDLVEMLKTDDKEEAPITHKELPKEEETYSFFESCIQAADDDKIEADRQHKFTITNLLMQAMEDMLLNMADTAVEKAENIEKEYATLNCLDRAKLLKKLVSLAFTYTSQKKINVLLRRRIVEFYRRKRLYRLIIPCASSALASKRQTYQKAFNRLNELLQREQQLKKNCAKTIPTLKADLAAAEQLCNKEVEQFDYMIRRIMIRKNEEWQRLPASVERYLKLMHTFRNEISMVRLAFIEKQHTVASLDEQLQQMDDMGNGLKLQDFQSMSREVSALEKKLDERNAEVVINRKREVGVMHCIGHMKERSSMLRIKIKAQKKQYRELIDKRRNARNKLYNIKLQRGEILKHVRRMCFLGILMDKPKLLFDYDKTVIDVKAAKKRVFDLRSQLSSLEDQVQQMEKVHAECLNSLK